MNLKGSCREARKYGALEVLYRKLYGWTKDQSYWEKMLLQKGKAYRRFTEAQMEAELRALCRGKLKREMNLAAPETFTEKIQWLKLHDSTPEKTRLADKYLVRDWVEERIGEGHLVPLLGAWDSFDEIDFDRLPDRFCLKMNHGSGMNYAVKDKAKMDREDARKRFKLWVRYPYWVTSLEFQYRDIPRRIIAEEYIEEMSGGLCDYKIHCFGGRPAFIQCIGERDLEKHSGYQSIYDPDWNLLDWTFETYPRFPHEVPRPARLDEMLRYAAALSRDFCYVRVDLYEAGDRVLFGEMTFTPASGMYRYRGSWTRERDVELGKLLKLPAAKV